LFRNDRAALRASWAAACWWVASSTIAGTGTGIHSSRGRGCRQTLSVLRRVVVRRRRVRPSLIVVLLARLTDMIAEAGGTARPDLILFLRTALREEAR